MPRTHERTFRIRHYECDAYENVYYTNYLRYMQETAMDASAAAGFGASPMAVASVTRTPVKLPGPHSAITARSSGGLRLADRSASATRSISERPFRAGATACESGLPASARAALARGEVASIARTRPFTPRV